MVKFDIVNFDNDAPSLRTCVSRPPRVDIGSAPQLKMER